MNIYTLIYLEKDEKYLMLYRNKKKNDINKGKWIGLGGKIEKNEDPYIAIKREVEEESGYILNKVIMKGLLKFEYKGNLEYIFVFKSDDFKGNMIKECNEGELKFIPKNEILNLNLWESDRAFLKELLNDNENFFIYDIKYDNHGKLVKMIKER